LETEEVIYVLNCPCTIADREHYKNIIHKALSNGTSIITVAINARKIVMFNYDPEFRKIFDQNVVLPVPDGIGATVPMRLFNKKASQKIDFPGFMFDLCDRNGVRCFFLGTTESLNEKAVAEIQKIYPGIIITGRHSGFDIDEEALLAAWFKSKTQVVYIAMGSPRQEVLSARLAKRISGVIFVGVGGRFDIIANEKKRAPKLLINLGLEWSFRFFSEPTRIKQQKKDIIAYLSLFSHRLFHKAD
jgi:N-acetylglucosaminyldiphosphoundecaprenol N-acetyl-beta-D-mannosaminyltransferase